MKKHSTTQRFARSILRGLMILGVLLGNLVIAETASARFYDAISTESGK